MVKWGYARISSDSQNLNLQIEALSQANVEYIFKDVYTGVSLNRPGWNQLINNVGKGDTIVVYKLDRLSRKGLLETLALIQDLSDKDIYVQSITEGIDTSNNNPMSKAFLGLLAVFAELERSIIKERVAAGIAQAKKQGKYTGRKRFLTKSLYLVMQNEVLNGKSVKDVCKNFGVSRTAYYDAKKLFGRYGEMSEE